MIESSYLSTHGGSAFPNGYDEPQSGMTLQDYFAGQAMQALLSNKQGAIDKRLIAKLAYEYADAMIEQWSHQS